MSELSYRRNYDPYFSRRANKIILAGTTAVLAGLGYAGYRIGRSMNDEPAIKAQSAQVALQTARDQYSFSGGPLGTCERGLLEGSVRGDQFDMPAKDITELLDSACGAKPEHEHMGVAANSAIAGIYDKQRALNKANDSGDYDDVEKIIYTAFGAIGGAVLLVGAPSAVMFLADPSLA